ncbi:MAG: hypothetical protein WC494_04270 [Candidatus Pacearchaeota archaeon]
MTKPLKELKKISGKPIGKPQLFFRDTGERKSKLVEFIEQEAPSKADSFLIGEKAYVTDSFRSDGAVGIGGGFESSRKLVYYAVQYYQSKQ